MKTAVPDDSVPAAAPAEDTTVIDILIVDDDDVDRMTVRRTLARAGLHVDTREAGTAADALAAAAAAEFDCVFLDYNLPGTDGLSLLRQLRQRYPDTAVIMLTGQGDERVAVELMKAGAVDYLPKTGLTPERLTSSLRYALELRRAAAMARGAEDELRQSVLRARFLAEASAVLTGSLDLSGALNQVAHLAVPYLSNYCIIYTLDDRGAPVAVAAAHHDPQLAQQLTTIRQQHRPVLDHAVSPVSAAVRTGERQILTDINDAVLQQIAGNEAVLDAFRALLPTSVLVLPLTARRRTLGAVAFARTHDRPVFTAAELDVAEDLAQRTAIALDNARLLATAQDARRRTELLQRVTASLAAALPRHEVGTLFVDQVREALNADTAWVALLEPDGREFTALVHGGFEPGEIEAWSRFPVEAPVPSRDVMQDGRARWFTSRSDLTAQYTELLDTMRDMDQEALGVLPLDAGHGRLGVLTIGFRQQRTFSDDDRALALALAGQFAQALERARLYDAERAARQRAETANRAKSEFLARMSHDLRTPLNAIGGYSELVAMGLQGPVTDQQVDAMSRINRAKDHLLTLINDILSFAKLEAGQVTIDIGAVDVHTVVRELGPLLQTQIEAKGLVLVVPEGPPVIVSADHERLLQVLVNLVTNSVKFTAPGGRIEISAAVEPTAVAISVADTGIGIPPDRLATIFDPFVQAGQSAADQREGVGLGLAISRELVKLMGGELSATSVEGEGSVFTLRLPHATTPDTSARNGDGAGA